MKTRILNRLTKTISALVLATALALSGTVPSFADENTFEGAGEAPDTLATSVVLMDAGSGEVVYEKDAHEKRDPASITKILNLLVCLDTLDFDEEVTVEIEPEHDGSIMKLQKGEKIKIRDLVYGMMLWSANDAAEYLGYLAGDGDLDAFCDMMDAKAKALGAKDTDYENPNGLNNEAVNNVTTAYDIATIVRQGMKDKRFRKIIGTREYVIPATNKYKKRKLTNSNLCLWSDLIEGAAKGDSEALEEYIEKYKSNPYNAVGDDEEAIRQAAEEEAKAAAKLMYKPCIGGKTGYSSTAGDCFAGIAKKGNSVFIAVVLNSAHTKTRFQDAKKLWKYAYRNFQTYDITTASEVQTKLRVRRGELRKVELGLEEDLSITMLKDENPEEQVTTELDIKDEKPYAPIRKGEVLGQIVVYNNGTEVTRKDLVALEKVGKGGPLSYIGIADEDVPLFLVLVGLALVTLLIIIPVARSARKRRERRERRRARKYGDS